MKTLLLDEAAHFNRLMFCTSFLRILTLTITFSQRCRFIWTGLWSFVAVTTLQSWSISQLLTGNADTFYLFGHRFSGTHDPLLRSMKDGVCWAWTLSVMRFICNNKPGTVARWFTDFCEIFVVAQYNNLSIWHGAILTDWRIMQLVCVS